MGNGLFFMMKEHMPSLEKSCSSLEDKIADRLKKKTKEPKTPNPMELLGNPPLGGAMGFNVSVTNNYPALERVVVEDLNFAGGSIVRDFCKQEINGVDSVEDTPSTSGPDIPDLLDKVTSFSNSIFGNLERAMDSGRKECDKKERKERKRKRIRLKNHLNVLKMIRKTIWNPKKLLMRFQLRRNKKILLRY